MRENAEWISDERKAQGQAAEETLRAAVNEKDITPESLQAALDGLQQVIFAIGAEMYRQVNNEEGYDVAMDETTPDMPADPANDIDMSTDTPVEESSDPVASDPIDLLENNPEFDLDATITADYEAIE